MTISMVISWLASTLPQSLGQPTVILAAIIGLALLLLLRADERSRLNLPPGPWALPYVGNLLMFAGRSSEPYLVSSELADKYGAVYSLYFGNYLTVFFNDYQTIKEVFVKQSAVFSDRPRSLKLWKETVEGLGLANGKDFDDVHRTTIRSLREAGVGTYKVEQRILTEAEHLCAELEKLNGEPFDCTQVTQSAFSNLTFNICLGERFDDYSDSKFRMMVNHLYNFLDDMRIAMTESFLPILGAFRPDTMISKLKQSLVTMDEVIGEYTSAHKESHIAGCASDCLDLFVERQMKEPDNPLYSDLFINRTIGGVLNGGIESTQTGMRWLLLYFLHYPHIQKRCFDQINEVLGTVEKPSWEMREKLTYVMATLLEVLRHANIAPQGVPHAASRDTMVNGYFIPKDTMVFMNLYHVHMDPKYWPEPKAFKPERWIDGQGKLIRHEAFIPFSIGKRHCLGEQLAKQELLLVTVCLLQKFEFVLPENYKLPDLKGIQKLSLAPKQYLVCVKPRSI
ncbi:vitamin D 25-hydroxylase-like isoform X2 [Lineus longissimus]|uniref:vitamin D 25-hydroxylase-like isoform X2 n=1 Tax=Lineus longissimus TaxID=88925 RepID=UPI00315D2885